MSESKARQLLLELARSGLLPATVEPELLLSLPPVAGQQGLSGLLLLALERERPAWAEPLLAPLASERRERLARTLGQIAVAARALSLLARAGIRALPLKGAALAETVYDLESDRPMSDVDLLALGRWVEAAGALRSAGFEELALADHARVLLEPGTRVIVELHRSPTSAPGLYPLDVEALWARRRPGARQLAVLPSVEDLLLQLALHAAFQHGFVLSLVQWLDFRRLLERETIDVARLRAIAASSRAEVPLLAALRAAQAVVAAPVPPALATGALARLPTGLERWLEPRLRDPLMFVTPSPAAVGRARWALLAGRRLELLWRTLVLPETARGDTRLVPRLVQAAGRLARLGRGALPWPASHAVHGVTASLTRLRPRD